VERGAPSTRHTTATGSRWAMAIWAAWPAGSTAPDLLNVAQELGGLQP